MGDGFIRINCWVVLESGVEKAKKEIERIIKNFPLEKVTKFEIGEAMESDKDYKARVKGTKSLNWVWLK